MASTLRVIVTGLIAQHRQMGGVAWDYLNVLLGLRRLGHDVYYLEDSGEWPYRLDGTVGDDALTDDAAGNADDLGSVMQAFGLEGCWAYRARASWFGMEAARRDAVVRSADLLLNVSGTLDVPERYRAVPRLVYLDTDPVFTQIRLAQGEEKLTRRVDAHDMHFTVGERLGPSVPETGHRWRPTKHPIVLDEWRTECVPRDVFTTVMNWTSYRPVEFGGRRYGQKDVELRRFLGLPAMVPGARLELALPPTQHVDWETESKDLPPSAAELIGADPDLTPRDLLDRFGWLTADAAEVCRDFRSYRHYVQSSQAEWSVAKAGYVTGPSGWFSGRSGCYLAAGRPVVVQNTGFSSVVPLGLGVLAFSTPEEAADAIVEVCADYDRHSTAAAEIADHLFDSDRVLTRLLDEVYSAGDADERGEG